MRAPDLCRSLVLERRVRVADGLGGYTETWVAEGRLWAEVRAGTGRAAAGEEVIGPEVGFRILVRGAGPGAPSRPVAGQRFRDGSRVFDILAVAEADPRGRHLTCFAREAAT